MPWLRFRIVDGKTIAPAAQEIVLLMPAPSCRLRQATPDDAALVYAITRDAMRGYVEQAWGCWNDDEQRRRHRESYTPGTHRLVEVRGAVAGLVATENLPDHLLLARLYLLTAYRGQGIGSALIARVVREAQELGKPVRLRVLRVNTRARALYARHGFSVVEETRDRFCMERPLQR